MDMQDNIANDVHYELDEVTNHFLSEYPVHCAYRTAVIGQQHLHAHDGFEVYVCTSGTGSLLAGDQLFPLHAGTLTIIPPNVLHRPYSNYVQPFHRFVLSLGVSYLQLMDQLQFTCGQNLCELLGTNRSGFDSGSDSDSGSGSGSGSGSDSASGPDPSSGPGSDSDVGSHVLAAAKQARGSHYILTPAQFDMAHKLLLELVQLDRKHAAWELRQLRLLTELILLMLELKQLPDQAAPSLSADEHMINEVLAYLVAHYQEELHIQHLTERFPVSRSRLLQQFKAKTGTTINAFISEYRLNQAKLLLRSTARPVTEVAALAGFGDLSHFFNLFKRTTGLTPQQYRHAGRGRFAYET